MSLGLNVRFRFAECCASAHERPYRYGTFGGRFGTLVPVLGIQDVGLM